MHKAMEAASDFEECVALRLEAAQEYGIPSIPKQLVSYANWADSGALVLRFEDLVGLRGGGTAEKQHFALRSLYEHLSCGADATELTRIGDDLFSDASPTFRSGQIDEWRQHLSGRVMDVASDLFAAEFTALDRPDVLRELGYDD